MPLKVEPRNFKTPDDEMSFGDFVIRYEHKFLRNIYTKEPLEESYHIKDLESYYEIFEEYIGVCIGLLALLNNFNRNDFINSAVEKFVEDKFYEDEIIEIKNTTGQTEIKNVPSSTFGKAPKFNLKIYAYVFDELICFPRSDTGYVTGKILGYAHDFCNTAVTEKTTPDIPFIAHNLFGFDLYYFIKGYIASAWCSKALNTGGTNLTKINFGNIFGETKLINTLKFYQKRLADLASTLSDEERIAIKKVTEKFSEEHYYFSTTWSYLGLKKKK